MEMCEVNAEWNDLWDDETVVRDSFKCRGEEALIEKSLHFDQLSWLSSDRLSIEFHANQLSSFICYHVWSWKVQFFSRLAAWSLVFFTVFGISINFRYQKLNVSFLMTLRQTVSHVIL